MELPEPIEIPYINSNMKKHVNRGNKIMKYMGNPVIMMIFYIYLYYKYQPPKSRCLVHFAYNDELSENDNVSGFGICLYIFDMNNDETDKYINILKNISLNIVDCMSRGVSPIIIPCVLWFGKNDYHANLLIIRPDNTIEHFEPLGKQYCHIPEINEKVEMRINEFIEILNTMIKQNKHREKIHTLKLIESDILCPHINGLQNLENLSELPKYKYSELSEYCIAWSMFFAELILKNPSISSKDLYMFIYDKVKGEEGKNYLRKMIRGYVHYISIKIDKYFTILFGEKIDISKIIDKNTANLIGVFIEALMLIENKITNENVNELEYLIEQTEKLLVQEKKILNTQRNIKQINRTNIQTINRESNEYKLFKIRLKLNMIQKYLEFKENIENAKLSLSSHESSPDIMSIETNLPDSSLDTILTLPLINNLKTKYRSKLKNRTNRRPYKFFKKNKKITRKKTNKTHRNKSIKSSSTEILSNFSE